MICKHSRGQKCQNDPENQMISMLHLENRFFFLDSLHLILHCFNKIPQVSEWSSLW